MLASNVRYLRLSLIAIIGVVLVLVASNYIQTFRKRAHIVHNAAQILGSEMKRAGESIEYSEYDKGTLRFQIRAEKLLETRQGKNLLQGIEASDRNADGTVGGQIRSRKGVYDRDHRQADFSEDVQVNLGQGIQLRTNSLHYDLGNNIGSTDESFEFASNQARGKARGFRYDHSGKNLHLNGDVNLVVTRVVLKPDGSVEIEESHVTSDRGYLSRTEQLFRFEGNAHLESATAMLSGERIEATFDADMKRLKSLYCEGNAFYQSNDSTDPRTLAGDRIVFGIESRSGALESIDVQGHADFSSKAQNPALTLHAAHLVLDLDPVRGLPSGIHGQGAAEFHMRRGSTDTVVSGEQLEAGLQGNTPQNMRVWENARMLMGEADGKGRDELHAGEIRLSFKDVEGKSVLHEMQAERSVQLQWNSALEKPGGGRDVSQSLKAALLRMRYGQNGDAPESGSASGNVVITGIPSGSGQQEIRRLQADTVQFGFYPGNNRLKDFSGEGHIQVFFSKAANQAASSSAQGFHTSSSNIHATFQQSDGAIDSMSQWGNFTLEDGLRMVTSGRSDYDATRETIVLRDVPKVVDSSGVTTGETMEYNRKDRQLVVRRHVRSLMKPGQGVSATPFSASPGATSSVIITAELLEAWTEEERARYSGGVQLLAETTELEADSLERLQGGDLIQAQGNVRNLILKQEQAPEAKKPAQKGKGTANGNQKPDASLIRVQSDQLKYVQAERTIHYLGNVKLRSGDIDISCAGMDALLDETGKQIEHATARGNLLMRQAERTVKGDDAEYFLTLGKIVVTGNPAEINDQARRSKSSARRLTFFTMDDRILLDSPLTTGTARD